MVNNKENLVDTISEAEFEFAKPEIFSHLSWLNYTETRHIPDNDLTGNVSTSPRVLNEEKFLALKPDGISYEDWLIDQKALAIARLSIIQESGGFDKIGHPLAVHDTSLINLDADIDSVDYTKPRANATQADITLLSTPGTASMIAPADCAIATIAFPEEKAVGQIHIGFQGAEKDIVSKALLEFQKAGLDTTKALIYISPHVQTGFPLADTEQRAIHDDLLEHASNEMRGIIEGNTDTSGVWPEVYLTQMVLDEFEKNGIDKNQVEVSPIDTFSDPKVFSEYKGRTDQKADGRFAVVVGIKK